MSPFENKWYLQPSVLDADKKSTYSITKSDLQQYKYSELKEKQIQKKKWFQELKGKSRCLPFMEKQVI